MKQTKRHQIGGRFDFTRAPYNPEFDTFPLAILTGQGR
jgi:hypothetical protein